MRKLLLAAASAALAVLALAAPDRVHAQAADTAIETIPGAPPTPPETHGRRDHGQDQDHARAPHGPRLFISPSGEPFRGGDGLAAWFAQADADHDGRISLAEFQADALRAFKLYDENGDGVIDGFEIQDYERQRAPEISTILAPGEGGGGASGGGEMGGGRHSGPRGGGMGGSGDPSADAGAGERQPPARLTGAGRDGAARFSLLNEPEPLLAADADVDGKVSLAEWKRRTDHRFAELDKTHDGQLTLDELRQKKK